MSELIGVVRGFTIYTAPQLEKMKTDLWLTMPVERLAFCQEYYKASARRDPYIAEIKLLDRFYANRALDIGNTAVAAFTSSEEESNRTYRDLLQKRAELEQNAQIPCTFREISLIGNQYLARSGKDFPTFDATLTEPLWKEEEAPTLTLPGSDQVMSLVNAPLHPLHDGDLLLLISRKENDKQFTEKLAVFWKDPRVESATKRRSPVLPTGLLDTLVRMIPGAWVDVCRFAEAENSPYLKPLTDAPDSAYLFRINEKDAYALWQIAEEYGISAICLAKVSPSPIFSFGGSGKLLFSLHTTFLQTLYRGEPHTLTCEEASKSDTAPFCGICESSNLSAYLSQSLCHRKKPGIQYKNTLVSGSVATLSMSPYKKSVRAALSALFALALSGCALSEDALQVTVSTPKTAEKNTHLSEIFSALLGIYRVQAELALPTSLRFRVAESKKAPILTVYAAGSLGKMPPMDYAAEGHPVYLLKLSELSKEFSDFEPLRQALADLSALAKSGAIKSARILCGQSLSDLFAQNTEEIYCRMERAHELLTQTQELALLIETDCRIPALLIGHTAVRNLSGKRKNPVLSLMPGKALNHYGETKAVIYAEPDDGAACALRDFLLSQGLASECISSLEKEDKLSALLLSSQILILGRDAALPSGKGFLFAYDTFLRAGGTALLPLREQPEPSLPDAIPLPEGITAQILSMLLEK